MSQDRLDSLTIAPYMGRDARFKSKSFSFPIGVRLANKVLASYKDKDLVPNELIGRAIKKSGLDDFGSDFWIDPMNQALKDLNESTNFHPLGAFLYEQKAIQNLINRLWAQDWLKRDDTINAPLPPTVLITGLQRTGTTFLQRLLGAMPEFRGVISWEIINPVPTSTKKKYNGLYLAWAGHKALNYINPEFKAIHALSYDSLDEEVALMDHCFMSSIIESAFTAPNYSRWLEQQDQKPAYQDLKMWLQFLIWRKPAKDYLLLKSPHHMEYLEDFSSVFPNTKIIYMHRDPAETIGSYCSMMHYSKKMFQSSSNPHAIGQHWIRKNKRFVDRCLEYKSDHEDQFVDISYKELIKDPIGISKGIYRELDLEWTEEHTILARAYCMGHKKNKFGQHFYDLSDYGLSREVIHDTFSDYMSEYHSKL